MEFAAEVRKYSRDGKVLTLVESCRGKKQNHWFNLFFLSQEQFRVLVLTGKWLYVIDEVS